MMTLLLLFSLVAYPTAAEEEAQNVVAVQKVQKANPGIKIVPARRTAERHGTATGKPLWECENKTPVKVSAGAKYCEVK